ncbi:MAG: MotA/TolQ/ExbB proton channel family protein [Myxococcota bacterium]
MLRTLRISGVAVALAGFVGVPLLLVGVDGPELAAQNGLARGVPSALDQVGWVVLPQIVLAVGVVGLALERLLRRAGGLPTAAAPAWLDPAIESALLLGMLGTLSGMVSGFSGLSPEDLAPAPLLHALGRALRSSLVGFAIALVGVWARELRPQELAS